MKSILQRIFSPILFLILIVAIILLVGCQAESRETFPEITKRLSLNIKQLQKEPGVTLIGFAADPDRQLFKVGVAFDSSNISLDRLKQVVNNYLEDALANTQSNNWNQILKSYGLQIEKIDGDKTTVIAAKESGASDLTWIVKP